MLVKSLAIGDTLIAGVSSNDLAKPMRGCARTIAAAVEQLLLTHALAAIARGFSVN
jgi:bifunctional ADP-heptose synthase (sugar kinase/adenylyltransferase)